jgi:hypothetical protein
MSDSLLANIHDLPADVRDKVKIYALSLSSLSLKTELKHHFERKEAEMLWWKVSEDWVAYIRDLEYDFDEMTLGFGNPCCGLGLKRSMTANWRGHCHPMESWYRETPIRYATTVEEKEAVSIPPLSW